MISEILLCFNANEFLHDKLLELAILSVKLNFEFTFGKSKYINYYG